MNTEIPPVERDSGGSPPNADTGLGAPTPLRALGPRPDLPRARRSLTVDEIIARDREASPVMSGIDPKDWTRLRARAGFPKAMKWEKIKAIEQFGHLLKIKLVARIHAADIFTQIEQCDKAIEYCRKVQDDNNATTENRLQAVRMQASIAQMRQGFVDQSIRMMEKGADRVESGKPKNLPPMLGVNVQVNNGRRDSSSIEIQPVQNGSAPVPRLNEGDIQD